MSLLTSWLCTSLLIVGLGELSPTDSPDSSPSIQAKTLREALPEGSLAYIAFPDLATTAREYRTAAIYRMFQDENVRKAIAPLFSTEGPIEEMLRELPVPLDLDLLLELEFQRVEVALTHIHPAGRHQEPGAEGEPDLGLVIDVQIGDSEEAWDKVIDWFEEVMTELAGPLPEGRPASFEVAGIAVEYHGGKRGVYIASPSEGRTILAFSRRTVELVLPRLVTGGGELNKEPVFQRSFSRVTEPGDDLQLWVNLGGFVSTGRGLLEAELPEDENSLEIYDNLVVALGLDEAQSFAWVHRLVAGQVESASALIGGESRRGLFSLLPEKNITNTAWQYVPKDALLMGHASIGARHLIQLARDVSKAIDYDLLDDDLEKFHQKTGFDVEADFAAKLTGEVLYFQTAPTGMIPIPGTVVLIGMRDAGVLVAHAEDILAEISPGASLARTRFRDVDIYVLKFDDQPLPIQPAWAVIDGYLAFSAHSQDIKGLIRRRGDASQSIVSNERFRQATARTGVPEEFASMSYYDIPALFEVLFTTGQQVIGFLGESGAIDVAQLPTAADLAVFLTGSASYSTCEKGAWQFKGVSPIGPDFYAGAFFGFGLFTFGARGPGMLPVDTNEYARSQLAQTRALLEVYQEQHGRYPKALDELGDPSSDFLIDPWGNLFVYRLEEGRFELYSMGPNGVDDDGIADDIR